MRKAAIWFSLTVIAIFSGYISFYMAEMPSGYEGIAKTIMYQSKTQNYIIAVALNFRAYDTLLVLLIVIFTIFGALALAHRKKDNEGIEGEK